MSSNPLPAATILVVEDDRLLLRVTLELLRDEGYQALSASDGANALTTLRAWPETSLLVSDINMPGMNGLDLVKIARSEFPGLTTLLISGREVVDVKALAQPAAFLQKPFSASSFLSLVRQLLAS